jgi:HAMP domain-containing protein
METLVFRRLNKMIESIEDISVRVAGGDFDAHFVADGSMDEIGQFEQFFARFMDLISATLKSLINR